MYYDTVSLNKVYLIFRTDLAEKVGPKFPIVLFNRSMQVSCSFSFIQSTKLSNNKYAHGTKSLILHT